MHRTPLAVLLLLAAACAPRYGVARHDDPFERVSVRRMRADVLGGGGADWVALNAEETRPAGDTARYSLVVDYRTQGEPLDIRPGESLLLLVDGDRVALQGPGSTRARAGNLAGRRETARYPASGALMRRIAAAKDVRVRIIGRRYHVDRAFTDRNLARFRRFLGLPDAVAPRVQPSASRRDTRTSSPTLPTPPAPQPPSAPPTPAPGPPPAR